MANCNPGHYPKRFRRASDFAPLGRRAGDQGAALSICPLFCFKVKQNAPPNQNQTQIKPKIYRSEFRSKVGVGPFQVRDKKRQARTDLPARGFRARCIVRLSVVGIVIGIGSGDGDINVDSARRPLHYVERAGRARFVCINLHRFASPVRRSVTGARAARPSWCAAAAAVVSAHQSVGRSSAGPSARSLGLSLTRPATPSALLKGDDLGPIRIRAPNRTSSARTRHHWLYPTVALT